jgi:hypothetical protein
MSKLLTVKRLESAVVEPVRPEVPLFDYLSYCFINLAVVDTMREQARS